MFLPRKISIYYSHNIRRKLILQVNARAWWKVLRSSRRWTFAWTPARTWPRATIGPTTPPTGSVRPTPNATQSTRIAQLASAEKRIATTHVSLFTDSFMGHAILGCDKQLFCTKDQGLTFLYPKDTERYVLLTFQHQYYKPDRTSHNLRNSESADQRFWTT